jgi:hypothetical protein
MDLDFLDKIWQGIGNIGADTDKFMKREMPYDSGWGAPAALVAAYYGGPAVMEAMGGAAEGAGAVGSAEGVGGMSGYLESLGMGGGEFMPTAGNSFELGGVGDVFAGFSPTGSSAGGNGFNGYTPQEQAGLDDLIAKQSAKYPMDGASKKPSFQQLLGKQLMSGGMGNFGSKGGFQYQDTPVQRQPAFAATPAPFQVQSKDSDIAALIAALKKKDLG